jgi:CheY-like chemotaxis protein
VNSHLEIRVVDNGKGVKPEFLPFIFERFSQSEPSTTRLHGGLGMGLAISRAIVELHGGTVVAFSEGEGKGTTFTVTLPVMPVSTQRVPAERVHPKAWTDVSMTCPPEISKLKVLVIDDDPDTCDMIRSILEQCGGVVETTTNADSGLELFRSWTPDVVVSDIGLPETDGFELIRRIRNDERSSATKTPAIALTAFARIEDRVKALAAGFQMHVAKPVEPAELLTIVASLASFMNRHG